MKCPDARAAARARIAENWLPAARPGSGNGRPDGSRACSTVPGVSDASVYGELCVPGGSTPQRAELAHPAERSRGFSATFARRATAVRLPGWQRRPQQRLG
jgi:hypothetical protein